MPSKVMLTKEMSTKSIELSTLQQKIINHYQKDLPLCSTPYQEMASVFSCDEKEILIALDELNTQGVLSRIGAVFDHKKAGASTLAAIAVTEGKLDEIAEIVNQFTQVNHNYAREHYYNLWFVVTEHDPIALAQTLQDIEQLTGLPILVLPMEASYHIDLGFKINFNQATELTNKTTLTTDSKTQSSVINKPLVKWLNANQVIPLISKQQNLLREILEQGLPVLSNPYLAIAQNLSATEEQVQSQIMQWQQTGLIRRFGLVVKHRKLGFNANAMVVWNIPNQMVDEIAKQLSMFNEVSLCYRRPRRLPDWPYNLFCMIHGTDRQVVLAQIKKITEQLLANNPELEVDNKPLAQDILFSYKAYKQQGARYNNMRTSQPHSQPQPQPLAEQSIMGNVERAHG